MRACLLSPEVLEARGGQLSVADRVLNVSVAEIGLQGAGIVSLVRQRVAAGMAQHMWVRLKPELGLNARPLHHASEPRRAEGCRPLRSEHEGRLGFLLALKPPQRP